jgi:hypothetical protein
VLGVQFLNRAAQVQPLAPNLVDLGPRRVTRRFNIAQPVRKALSFGRGAAERTVLIAANSQQEAGFLDRFQPLDVGAVNLFKLLEPTQIDFDFSQPLLRARNGVGQFPLGRKPLLPGL